MATLLGRCSRGFVQAKQSMVAPYRSVKVLQSGLVDSGRLAGSVNKRWFERKEAARFICTTTPKLLTLDKDTMFERAKARMAKYGPPEEFPVKKTDEEWKQDLTLQEYNILRLQGTEMANTGEYVHHFPKTGHYNCRGCSASLYTASAKFSSGCGWPSFDKFVDGSVSVRVDTSHGMFRKEIVCSHCGGHLGHVFHGENCTSTNERHCVNSLSIVYNEESLTVTETTYDLK